MTSAVEADTYAGPTLRQKVRSAVIWRSGTQILGQVISWLATFLVIRILSPGDYGLYAMTSVVLGLLALLNGYGLANAYIQKSETSAQMLRQLFGMLIVLNGVLATIQILTAPLVAAYYEQPVVADMLRVQALIYLTNPFLALGYAILSREMDFRRQAQVNIASALIGAFAALGGALAGMGAWTLVLAPIALFSSRAIGMALVARAFTWPSFNFNGVWDIARYGGMMTVSSLFWFVQTQADVVIAGRAFPVHELGIYTTSLFLAQIFVTKVVPPLNEVAFSAYARVKDDRDGLASGFVASTRLIMLLALPMCLGLAATAQPLIHVMLGDKWLEATPVVRLLALAMPFMTLHVLLAPATNAVGKPGLATRTTALGAVLMPAAFLVGAQFGSTGIAAAWLIAYPLLATFALAWSLPAIGTTTGAFARALYAPVLAALTMALGVTLLDQAIGTLAPVVRLVALIATGAAIYGALLFVFARRSLFELASFVLRR